MVGPMGDLGGVICVLSTGYSLSRAASQNEIVVLGRQLNVLQRNNTLDAAAQDEATKGATPLPEIKVTTKEQAQRRAAAKRSTAPTSQGASPATGPVTGSETGLGAPNAAQAALDRKMLGHRF
jgi:hypothetical protein